MVVFWPQRGRNRAMRDTTTRVAERGEFDRDRLSNAKGGECGRSPRRGGWDEVLVDFRSHDFCPEIFGLAKTKGWFHVEIEKGMKEDECEKGHEQEAFDGSGVMFQDMIGVPTLDQFVESVVFDVPSLVPKTDGTVHGKLR